MTRRPLALLAAFAALSAVCATAAVAATRVSNATLTVTPSSVQRGKLVLVRGNAGACPVGDSVTVMSRAFVGTHRFAGVPAVFTKVRLHHRFHASTRIPAHKRRGRYDVTARCGGGNFGVVAHLVVLP
jgi:hypothetical protein